MSGLATIRKVRSQTQGSRAARSTEGLCGGGIAVVRGLEELGDVSKGVCSIGFFAWYCGSHVSLIGTQVQRESG